MSELNPARGRDVVQPAAAGIVGRPDDEGVGASGGDESTQLRVGSLAGEERDAVEVVIVRLAAGGKGVGLSGIAQPVGDVAHSLLGGRREPSSESTGTVTERLPKTRKARELVPVEGLMTVPVRRDRRGTDHVIVAAIPVHVAERRDVVTHPLSLVRAGLEDAQAGIRRLVPCV